MTQWIPLLILLLISACSPKGGDSAIPASTVSLTMDMNRVATGTYNPFQVIVNVKQDGVAVAGAALTLTVPKGSVTPVTEISPGQYSFTVTPSASGIYPVTVAALGSTIQRKAIVMNNYGTGVGQPMEIPGDYVNTEGYEDGITITPDGSYLFIQYGPVYFSGLVNLSTICSSGAYSLGYDLNTCGPRTNSGLIFNTIGPYNNYQRPNFSTAAFNANLVRHLPGFVIGGMANGLADFPTIFYGFKRQADGSFAEPFTLAFDDPKRVNAPYGLSFKMNGDGTGTFIMAWNNMHDNLGDDSPDIYTGQLTFGTNTNLGAVAYGASFSGDYVQSIAPNITPVGFSSHTGTQGNPHLYYDGSGVIKSIWTDDEMVSQNLSVYRLSSGVFPNGTWVKDTLPSIINTATSESQPFFTGTELILNRDTKIVSHTYRPTFGACANGFTSSDCWGPERVLLAGVSSTTPGEIYGVGEPTIATMNGKRYLYFVFVKPREVQNFPGVTDFNLDAGFVEIP